MRYLCKEEIKKVEGRAEEGGARYMWLCKEERGWRRTKGRREEDMCMHARIRFEKEGER